MYDDTFTLSGMEQLCVLSHERPFRQACPVSPARREACLLRASRLGKSRTPPGCAAWNKVHRFYDLCTYNLESSRRFLLNSHRGQDNEKATPLFGLTQPSSLLLSSSITDKLRIRRFGSFCHLLGAFFTLRNGRRLKRHRPNLPSQIAC